MLIARLAPTVHVHMLKHGGIASRGHCIAFPQAVQEPATILPRLPAEVDIVRVRRQGKDDTHKDVRVRRHRIEGALHWLKENNPAYSDIVIDRSRLQNLPEDGELPNVRTVEFSESEHIDDQGPAPQQLDAGETNGIDDLTVSGVILPEPGVNVQANVEEVLNRIVSESRDAGRERVPIQQDTEQPIIPWPTTDTVPASEFTTPYFFTMAFPCLFPYRKGDFHINRPITCPTLHEWAEHLLWYQDGRFARHKVWKFVVHNIIMRKRALEQSRYFVDQQLGDPHLTVAELQEQLARGDTSFANKLLYFGANLRGTAQYWHQRHETESWGTTIHKCQGMTVGTGQAFRYIVINPGKHDFEAKNPGAFFVALSRAKSAGGDGMDPDFAFHEEVLLNDDRLKPVNTPTTRARALEMERLHVLASECPKREALTAAYREQTFLRLIEWAQSRNDS